MNGTAQVLHEVQSASITSQHCSRAWSVILSVCQRPLHRGKRVAACMYTTPDTFTHTTAFLRSTADVTSFEHAGSDSWLCEVLQGALNCLINGVGHPIVHKSPCSIADAVSRLGRPAHSPSVPRDTAVH